jgi:hypothetical protein
MARNESGGISLPTSGSFHVAFAVGLGITARDRHHLDDLIQLRHPWVVNFRIMDVESTSLGTQGTYNFTIYGMLLSYDVG